MVDFIYYLYSKCHEGMFCVKHYLNDYYIKYRCKINVFYFRYLHDNNKNIIHLNYNK